MAAILTKGGWWQDTALGRRLEAQGCSPSMVILGRRVTINKLREAAQFLAATLPTLRRATGPTILFERYIGAGDVICTFPAVLSLREKFPGATIVYRVAPSLVPIVQMGRVADVVVPFYHGQWSLPGLCDRWFDMVFRPYLENEQPTGSPHVHLVDDFCAKVGVTTGNRQPRLEIPRGLSERVYSQLPGASIEGKPLIAIHTGPSWRVREWQDDGWQELVAWLVNTRHAHVIQLGADGYWEKGTLKANRVAGAVDYVGRFSWEETAACIQACDVFIGIDSGLLHIAGAVGTPCVGLFGALDPALRLPPETPSIPVVGDVPCLGCHHRTPVVHWRDNCPMEIMCMKLLPVHGVADACDKLLRQSRWRSLQDNTAEQARAR